MAEATGDSALVEGVDIMRDIVARLEPDRLKWWLGCGLLLANGAGLQGAHDLLFAYPHRKIRPRDRKLLESMQADPNDPEVFVELSKDNEYEVPAGAWVAGASS